MSKLQLKYFGKRKKSSPKKRKSVSVVMARRRGGFKRKAGGSRGGGGWKAMLAPVAGGLADRVIDPYSPIDGLGGTAAGMLLKDPITMKIGLYKVGYSLGNVLPIPGIAGGNAMSGGFS